MFIVRNDDFPKRCPRCKRANWSEPKRRRDAFESRCLAVVGRVAELSERRFRETVIDTSYSQD